MDGRRVQNGFTMIEAMVAITIMAIVAVGAVAYRSTAALDTHKATIQANAGRAGLYVLESWRASDDPNIFNPALVSGTDITVDANGTGPNMPGGNGYDGFTQLDNGYKITLNGFTCFATLCWKDQRVFLDNKGRQRRLRAYHIILDYDNRGTDVSSEDETNKSISLTTYKYY
ncbi:MAG: hypothetical protein A2Y07_04020 [Planctomycetes bacterium GWF2_50_10]|nr:MAG: hypothetical protein A2Y07_04020 [Planctomycetes bacterium GWF2_50_10]